MTGVALAAKETSEEAKREAARLMGSISTPKKAASSKANGFKPGNSCGKNQGRKHKQLSEFVCICDLPEDALEGHRWDCMRGQAIKRRIKEGRDLQTGQKAGEMEQKAGDQ